MRAQLGAEPQGAAAACPNIKRLRSGLSRISPPNTACPIVGSKSAYLLRFTWSCHWSSSFHPERSIPPGLCCQAASTQFWPPSWPRPSLGQQQELQQYGLEVSCLLSQPCSQHRAACQQKCSSHAPSAVIDSRLTPHNSVPQLAPRTRAIHRLSSFYWSAKGCMAWLQQATWEAGLEGPKLLYPIPR